MRTVLILLVLLTLSLAATGGPDGGGYYWFDQDESHTFYADNWIDISATGTLISAGWIDDSYGLGGSISWDFRFYGIARPDIYVSENGAVVFEDVNPWSFDRHYMHDHFPGPHYPDVDALVAPYWSDLGIQGGGEIFFQDFGDHFVIMWKEIDDWGHTDPYTFEMIGWEAPDGSTSSNLAFLYDHDPYDDYYVVGMQGDETTGTELQWRPDPADQIEPGDWYLLTISDAPFSAIEETTWGQIKASL